jgi:hypothetical protein
MHEYICDKCGQSSYSSVNLEHLNNKNCTKRDCGGKLVYSDKEKERATKKSRREISDKC